MEGVLQNMKPAGSIRVEPRGLLVGPPRSDWSFEVKKGHKLHSIKIEHGVHIINSLMFTTEFGDALSISDVFGRPDGAQTESMVTLDSDEEIVGIEVSYGIKGRDTYLSSLSFKTTKTTHGPFGEAIGDVFSLPWDEGSLVGFYGLASDWVRGISGIGVYLKPHAETMKIGPWGRPFNPQAPWSFKLEGNQRLNSILIVRGNDGIAHLMFNSSEKVDDRNGLAIDQVILDADEEIIGISGLFQTLPIRHTIISSISFTTNKKVHGPFGEAKGTPFSVSWDVGSFAGFFGFHGLLFDGIGVYQKATN